MATAVTHAKAGLVLRFGRDVEPELLCQLTGEVAPVATGSVLHFTDEGWAWLACEGKDATWAK
eukprot:9464071-Lingulodinium_polyedra.AAC.1